MRIPSLAGFAALLLLSGCTAKFNEKWADREVFGILTKKTGKVPNAGTDLLTVDEPLPPDLEELEKNLTAEEFLGDRAKIEVGAKKIDLAQALDYGVHQNRSYRDQKENVYLSALDLTSARHEFAPVVGAGGTTTLDRRQVETGMNNFITESTLTSTGRTSFSWLQRTGTRLAVDLTTDFVKFITGDVRSVSESQAAVTLTQPLLRGAGYLAVSESLTQAERNVLYSIRDFTQFRKTFVVSLTDQYFRTLQAREAARNNFLAYQSFNETVERETMLAETGQRATKSSLFQVRQAQLSSESRWRSAIRAYENALDDLKVELGLPVETPLLLDTEDLEELEIIDPPGSLGEAIETGLVTRLDLWNARDEVEDRARVVKIATQDLLPTLDAVASYELNGDPDRSNLNLDAKRRKLSGGLDLDLNLDRKPVRNQLRTAQIAEQRSRRVLDLEEEEVRQEIREAWRDLELARKQYDIATNVLAFAEERVTLEGELLREGRGTARDLIDAQSDLIDARNGIIAAKIAHTLARLELWRDMGVLFIRKDGSWATVMKKEKPKAS